MTNSIQNFFNNPRVKIIIVSIIIFIAITGISIYLRNLLTNPDPSCQKGYFYDESAKKCLIKCDPGKINDPNDLTQCIPNCQLKKDPAPGQTYNPDERTCQFKCGTNWCKGNQWLCIGDKTCVAPNCYDSEAKYILYCNGSSQTNNKCARDSKGKLVAGATGVTITNGCYTSNGPSPPSAGANDPRSGTSLNPDQSCDDGYTKSVFNPNITICCPTNYKAVSDNLCCPAGDTNYINSKCCPAQDDAGNDIKQVINGVCCPATSKGVVNGKCCDNPQTFSTQSETQTKCCNKGEEVIEGKCCPSASKCKYNGKTICLTDSSQECTVDGACPTTKVYKRTDGNKYCCDEPVTAGECYNVCKFKPDPSIMSGGTVLPYRNKTGDLINGIKQTSTGNLTCGYAYQKDNKDQYLTCLDNSTTKTSVCDAQAVCKTSLATNYTKGGIKQMGDTAYYYCNNGTNNYWNGKTGSTLEFNYSITPTSGATGPICQNVNMCQKNYPDELAITGTSSITINGENCAATLDCTGTTQTPPIAPAMAIVAGASGIQSYNGSITGGSYTVTLGPGANFLNSGQYAINGSIDGNSPAVNQIAGSFCSPAGAGNTYDNKQGNSILCYNSGGPLNYTPKFYSNVTNGFACDGNGFITGNSPDQLTCNCTMGSTLTQDKLACYNKNVSALIQLKGAPDPGKQINNLQVFNIPSDTSNTTTFSGNQTIKGSQIRSIIFFKVTNNKYKINGNYLNYTGSNQILTSSKTAINIMYISWNNVSSMIPNNMWQGLPMLRGLLFTSSNNGGGGISGTKLLPIITYYPESGTVNLDVYNFSTNKGASSPYVPGSKTGYFLTIAATNTGFYCIAAVSAIWNDAGTARIIPNIYFLAAKNDTTLQWIPPSNDDFKNGTSNAPFGNTLPSNLIIVNPLTHLSVSAFNTKSTDNKFLNSTKANPFSVSSITDAISQGQNRSSFDDIVGKLLSGFHFSRSN